MSTFLRNSRFDHKVSDFESPTQLPDSEKTWQEWQALNRAWWEAQPMRYDWCDKIKAEPGSRAYFEEIDRRFYGAVRHSMPWRKIPFDNLIDFRGLTGKDVLEIGVGHGSHAQLIAPFSRSFTGIDLTQTGSDMASRRLQVFGISARILCMDAERMDFPDQSFDFIWSWGVIHHSANPLRILHEMKRVLRPGGEATVMIYHRSPLYFLQGSFRRTFMKDFKRSSSLHRACQAATDGALARYYQPKEWKDLCEGLFEIKRFIVTGQKTDAIPIPAGILKRRLERRIPDRWTQGLTNSLRMGSFLIAEMRREN